MHKAAGGYLCVIELWPAVVDVTENRGWDYENWKPFQDRGCTLNTRSFLCTLQPKEWKWWIQRVFLQKHSCSFHADWESTWHFNYSSWYECLAESHLIRLAIINQIHAKWSAQLTQDIKAHPPSPHSTEKQWSLHCSLWAFCHPHPIPFYHYFLIQRSLK